MKFQKLRDVKTPTRGTDLSAGIDFYIPTFTPGFVEDFLEKNPTLGINFIDGTISLGTGERVLIPSGIRVEVREDHAFIAFNKSGVSTKLGLDVLACVIDEDYRGEIHISLVNTSKYVVDIYSGQKIIQFILIPVTYHTISMVEHIGTSTERGEGGFGSTNKKQ